jgi:NAD+ synthase
VLHIELSEDQVHQEINRICRFISKELGRRNQVVVAVSGGLDSDVVARLAKRTPAVKKIKLFTVLQDDMDPKHLQNARELAEDLKEELVELPFDREPFSIIKILDASDKNEVFYIDGLGLDVMRMKCSLRTCIISAYQDHGYIVLGTGNRTEYETGFYLPFGDGIAHLKPIRHLYKTQVRQMAPALGTREAVINQPASAGFWLGEEDLEDLAWWLFNEKPITGKLEPGKEDEAYVENIRKQLTTEKVDQILFGLSQKISADAVGLETGVSGDIIAKFEKLIHAADEFKNRGYNKQLSTAENV